MHVSAYISVHVIFIPTALLRERKEEEQQQQQQQRR
jgi:hypothetical protein